MLRAAVASCSLFLFCGAAFAQDAPAPARAADARRTVHAVRLTEPLKIDGRLDEPLYTTEPSTTPFIQIDPHNGEPGSQKTEAWISFDGNNVYASIRLWEAEPRRMVANEMRHDAAVSLSQNELLNVAFDTFNDGRNAFAFYINPIGGRGEGQVSNERVYNGDWNGVWEAEVGRFEGGWTVEIAVPFKTLRYRPGTEQVWGLQIMRNNRWKNEIAFMSPTDPARGSSAFMQASVYATLTGLEVPPPAMNLEVKPYAISQVRSDRVVSPAVSNDADGDVGVDVKYAVTQSLAADFTYNTDFAQVEADEQQVNLTRFSLFFPEKREFFLENAGTFAFGGTTTTSGGATGDAPILFYSRRIGLNGAVEVPLVGGGRLTGRVGRYSIGVLDIQTKDEPLSNARSANFSVLRVRRDILRRSAVGVMATGRSVAQSGAGTNQTYGVDGTFAFFANLAVNTYWARTITTGLRDDDTSYRAQFEYAGDRYGVQAEHLLVGDNFNPEVGFVRRDNMRKNFGQFRFSPRPQAPSRVRKYSLIGTASHIANTDGRLESRDVNGEFGIEFQSSDKLTVGYNSLYEFLPGPFRLAPTVTVPPGGYDFGYGRASFAFGQQRALYGTLSIEQGRFYNGDRTTIAVRQGRVKIVPQLSLEPSYSVNMIDLPTGSFTTTLAGSRVTYTMTPLMFVSALVQYNSSSNSVATNVRLRWEYRPGSELFAVYNEQRDTLPIGFPDLQNRAFIVKINRLLRF